MSNDLQTCIAYKSITTKKKGEDIIFEIFKGKKQTRIRDASGDIGFPSSQTTKSETRSTTPAPRKIVSIISQN